ncbi:hypothetical protein J2S59_002787 [Nocardioides massiliensis]|uniref:Transcriptional regulator n=1 Tax=Nocardioides massiliensis TaxID=1325935 RepID=A0ABT9NRF9_9ACTN|nr:hypothetical protein [Nocardioides massiliensis]
MQHESEQRVVTLAWVAAWTTARLETAQVVDR